MSGTSNDPIIIDDDEVITLSCKLKTILYSSSSNHKKEIIKESDLKQAHVYCKINKISGPVTGTLIEHYIKIRFGMLKNSVVDCTGDLRYIACSEDVFKNVEIKSSSGGKNHNKFNYVQLRPVHVCDYLLMAYHLDATNVDTMGELFIFKLSKSEMKDLIVRYGTYAHGTTKQLGKITMEDLDDPTNNKEYALRPKYDDKCWKELLLFRIYNL